MGNWVGIQLGLAPDTSIHGHFKDLGMYICTAWRPNNYPNKPIAAVIVGLYT